MSLKQTPLHRAHKQLGARLVDFAGWHMPVQYPEGVKKEHRCVRSAVGLFDVSHMGQARIRGAGAGAAVQRLITNDASQLDDGAALYTVMCYEHGGIVDDCIVYRYSETDYLIILNASNIDKDLAWIRDVVGNSSEVNIIDESEATALIAVQGPRAVALVDRLSPDDLASVGRFRFARSQVAGVDTMAARTGYTGEDGFELACPADRALNLWTALLGEGESDGAEPIGLGARDTLRLEAKLSLYGNDIDETTSPYEASLGWVVKLDAGDFVGCGVLARQKAEGVSRRLIGFNLEDRGIARHDYPIVDRSRTEEAQTIGRVTSGTIGIWVGGAIGMGYVPTELSKSGTRITIDCRGKDVSAVVHQGPFYRRGDS